jgi:hypothetical protein
MTTDIRTAYTWQSHGQPVFPWLGTTVSGGMQGGRVLQPRHVLRCEYTEQAVADGWKWAAPRTVVTSPRHESFSFEFWKDGDEEQFVMAAMNRRLP